MLAGSILARGMLSARSSLEAGEGNFCVAHAGKQRATTRLFGPRRLGEGVSSSVVGDGAVTAYPDAA